MAPPTPDPAVQAARPAALHLEYVPCLTNSVAKELRQLASESDAPVGRRLTNFTGERSLRRLEELLPGQLCVIVGRSGKAWIRLHSPECERGACCPLREHIKTARFPEPANEIFEFKGLRPPDVVPDIWDWDEGPGGWNDPLRPVLDANFGVVPQPFQQSRRCLVEEPSGSGPPPGDVSGMQSPRDLARRHGIPETEVEIESLTKRLGRFREKHPAEGGGQLWCEITDRKQNEARYLYNASAVEDICRAARKASDKRRTK